MTVPATIVSAIVSSIIDSIVDAPATTAPVEPSSAVVRSFPLEAKKGKWTLPMDQGIVINGTALPPAPGLQIRGIDNLIVLPMTLQATGTYPVRYQLDLMGNVLRVWILSSAEQSVIDPQQ